MISTYDEEEGDSEFNRNEPICNANTGKHEVNQGGSKCSPRGRDGWDTLVLLLGWVNQGREETFLCKSVYGDDWLASSSVLRIFRSGVCLMTVSVSLKDHLLSVINPHRART